MKEKDMYTLQELYNELEIPLSALGRKGDMSEGTVARIRDGFPARRSTINKLLRAFGEVYGIQFNLDNVSGIQIEDKKEIRAIEQGASPSVSTISIDDSTQEESSQNRIVEPKRAYTRKKESGLPKGCILATGFGLMHGVKRETFRDHMNRGLRGNRMDYSERPKPGREHETERYLTLEQQREAIAFWGKHDVDYSQCDRPECSCH